MELLYRDSSVLVCVKPAGVLSTDEAGGLPELAREALGDRKADVRTVHRLDRAVSGLIVLARGSAAALIESRMEWEEHFAKAGFQSVATNELTERILPDLKRLQKHFDAVMQHPFRAKIVFRTMPWRYTVNIISGWLGYDFTREHIGNYCEWILQKP